MKMAYEKIKSKLPIILLGLALISMALLMLQSAVGDSAIMDELAHIPAGYSYIKYLDFRLNPEHPPLLKALSAIPLLGLNLKFPLNQPSWTTDVNGQWGVGNQFLYLPENNADKIIFFARLFPILLTLITTLIIYLWSKKLFGKWWALLPAFLFGFSPTVLAHGHYVTTDIAATFGVLFGTYFFIKFLLTPKKSNLVFAGVALGLAELLKFSLVLLIPYFLIIAFFFLISSLKKHNLLYYVKSIILIFLIALAVIYAVYFLLTLNYPLEKQRSDTTAILGQVFRNTQNGLPRLVIWASDKPIIRPLAEYSLGVLRVTHQISESHEIYFRGKVLPYGPWYYFPFVYFIKEPLAWWALVLLALIYLLPQLLKFAHSPIQKFKNFVNGYFEESAMILWLLIYWATSMQGKLDIGVRHLLPTYPFAIILISGQISRISRTLQTKSKKLFLSFIALIILISSWYLIENIKVFPYYLSYFNQTVGGPSGGYRYVVDSNLDWGQDLKRLKNWVDARNNDNDRNNDVEKIAVDYFGGGNPQYYFGDMEENWSSGKGNPSINSGQAPPIKWLAVSLNTLEKAFGKNALGLNRNPNDEYRWLGEIKNTPPEKGNVPEPDFKIGTSIFVYKL